MSSSTVAGTPHFTLLNNTRTVGRRYPGRLGGLSTPAGMYRRAWLQRLRRALREDLFVLHYQPIVSLAGGTVCHFEALVRLADGAPGQLLAPAQFLPAAERYGLIGELDRLVISKALCTMAGDRQALGASVAVNVSALSVTDTSMLAHIEQQLVLQRVDPSRLIIEVTETAAIADMERAKRFCEGVEALGCAVALDDFGVGFGSLQYLKHLPFRYLKIDGDFIHSLPSSPKDQLVVRALVDLAAGMGKSTIAEFVGDEVTVRMLREYGVDYAQGFEIGRPAEARAAFARN